MFHFSNRQLHIIIGFLVVSMLLIATFLITGNDDAIILKGKLDGLDSFSDGWIASYETLDDAKWRKYGISDDKEGNKTVTEVLNLPNSFDIMAQKVVTLTHKIPDFNDEEQYIVFNSENQMIEILANRDLIYQSDENDISFPLHIVRIDHQYANETLTIKVKNDNEDRVVLDDIGIGDYTELVSDAFKTDGWLVIYGIFLILLSIILYVIIISVKSNAPKKLLLNYIGCEIMFAGILLCVLSTLFRTLIHWELFNYFLRTVITVTITVMHLLVIRCMLNRVKVLKVIDIGIVIYCIEFISIIILSWFKLVSFAIIYRIAITLSGVGLIIYTLLLGSAAYDYRQKGGRPVFISNLILVGTAVLELVLYITHADNVPVFMPVIIGSIIYFGILVSYGIKQVLPVNETDNADVMEMKNAIQQEVIDGFNPNLLFASFQTLQQLIKSGSDSSTKMIYYISVYVKNNIKAMNSRGEIILFSEELEHIIAYLNLQKTRNSGFSFVIESKVKDFKIPRNTIEPLVENAVKYGIGGKDNKGNVVVRSYNREEGYAIQIIDTGIGFDTANLKNTSSTSIKNLFEILKDKCRAKTEIISKENKGTVITIIIPMIENELI